MTASLETILIYTLPGVGMLALGGVAALLWKPGPTVRSCLQHFAAGVIFAVVAVELLPTIRRGAGMPWIGLGFGVGVVLMLALRWFSGEDQQEEDQQRGWPWGLLGAVAVDVFIDGLLLGIGFAVGARQGILLAVALAGEFLSLGLATAATLIQRSTRARWHGAAMTTAIALPFLGGATLGGSVLQGLTGNALAAVVSFWCAALLYLVTEELLVEAHEVQKTTVAAALFFAGFLLFLLLGMLE